MTDLRRLALVALLLGGCETATLEPIVGGPPAGTAGSKAGGGGQTAGTPGAGGASGAGGGAAGNAGENGGVAGFGGGAGGSAGLGGAGASGAGMGGLGGATPIGGASGAGASGAGASGAGGGGVAGSGAAAGLGGSAGFGGAGAGGAAGAGGSPSQFTLEYDAIGFVIGQGKPGETMSVTSKETWRSKSDGSVVCVVSFTVSGFATDTACPVCEWGFHGSLTDGVQDSGDCKQVGYASLATSVLSTVHYAFERDPLSPPYNGFLWRFQAGVWSKIGKMIVGGDPTTSCDLSWSAPAQEPN